MVHAIGEGEPGYKTRHLVCRTQKTTCPAQTQDHPQCQKETQVHAPGGHQRVGSRVNLFRQIGVEPWDTPSERVENIKRAVKRTIRKKTTDAAKKKAASLAKKALDWKTWKTP